MPTSRLLRADEVGMGKPEEPYILIVVETYLRAAAAFMATSMFAQLKGRHCREICAYAFPKRYDVRIHSVLAF
jgi:hypothetical protein